MDSGEWNLTQLYFRTEFVMVLVTDSVKKLKIEECSRLLTVGHIIIFLTRVDKVITPTLCRN